MNDDGVTRSVRLSTSLHFDSLADYRAAGDGQPVLPGQTAEQLDNGYGLQGNPTLQELQAAISKLEKGNHTLLFPSGLTALTALSAVLRTGDHWLLPDNVYAPMRRFADYWQTQFGVVCDYYDPGSVTNIRSLISGKTKLIHIETPGSATFDTTDIDAIVELAKAKGILTSADNTWAAAVLYQPLDHGVDISVLSLTKYPGGYSDVFMGSLTCRDAGLFKRFAHHHRVMGYTVSPFSAMLVSRGLESLAVRLAAHGANATQLVESIKGHQKVTKVYQAGLELGQDLAGPNGLFSIELDREYSDADLEKAFSKLVAFKIGESWGGTRSLVLPFQPAEFRRRSTPIRNTVIRFHAGLDPVERLQADLDAFLAALG